MRAGEVQPKEHELIARAQVGDRDAFADLVWRHQDAVYTLAIRLVGPDLAADVAQEALIRAWRALPRFRGEAAFATWLHRITVNTAWTLRRRSARHQAQPLDEELPARGPGPERAGELAETRLVLKRAIARLSEGQRTVLVLRDIYGWTTAETARELGITDTTVKVRLHRARRRLAQLIEESP